MILYFCCCLNLYVSQCCRRLGFWQPRESRFGLDSAGLEAEHKQADALPGINFLVAGRCHPSTLLTFVMWEIILQYPKRPKRMAEGMNMLVPPSKEQTIIVKDQPYTYGTIKGNQELLKGLFWSFL